MILSGLSLRFPTILGQFATGSDRINGRVYEGVDPNQPLQQTGHANDACARRARFSRVRPLLRVVVLLPSTRQPLSLFFQNGRRMKGTASTPCSLNLLPLPPPEFSVFSRFFIDRPI